MLDPPAYSCPAMRSTPPTVEAQTQRYPPWAAVGGDHLRHPPVQPVAQQYLLAGQAEALVAGEEELPGADAALRWRSEPFIEWGDTVMIAADGYGSNSTVYLA